MSITYGNKKASFWSLIRAAGLEKKKQMSFDSTTHREKAFQIRKFWIIFQVHFYMSEIGIIRKHNQKVLILCDYIDPFRFKQHLRMSQLLTEFSCSLYYVFKIIVSWIKIRSTAFEWELLRDQQSVKLATGVRWRL